MLECSADFYRSGRQYSVPINQGQAFTIIVIAILAVALLYGTVRYLALGGTATAERGVRAAGGARSSSAVVHAVPVAEGAADVMSTGNALTFRPGTLACFLS